MKKNKRELFKMKSIVNLWNSLSWEVVEVESIARFKKGLDKFVDVRSVVGY